MNNTVFSQEVWGLQTFNEVGYDANKKTFSIFYFDGSIIEFQEIEQVAVFEFILSTNKELYIAEQLMTEYPYEVKIKQISLIV